MNYVLIGDIHSQASLLENALSYIRKNISNSKVIFLGDIFDSKTKNSTSYEVYSLVREAEENLNAIILQSNHQDKLIRYLRGNEVYVDLGLNQTITELLKHISKDELYSWLIRQPFGIAFKDLYGVEYRCAHAYFSEEVEVQSYDEYYLIQALRKEHKHQFLYGLQDSKRNRIEWWNETQETQNFIRVAGHYRTVYLRNKSIVLDSCCGEKDGLLSIYDVNQKTLHQFGEKEKLSVCFKDTF
jgi:hypothetical protein